MSSCTKLDQVGQKLFLKNQKREDGIGSKYLQITYTFHVTYQEWLSLINKDEKQVKTYYNTCFKVIFVFSKQDNLSNKEPIAGEIIDSLHFTWPASANLFIHFTYL